MNRGDGPVLRALFATFADREADFGAWVGVLASSLRHHDTHQGFACELSITLAKAKRPTR